MAKASPAATTGIYRILNKANGKSYVGSAIGIETRYSNHIRDLKLGSHKSQRITTDWNEYGADFFALEVLEVVPDIQRLPDREQFWIDKLNSYREGITPRPKHRAGHSCRPRMIAVFNSGCRMIYCHASMLCVPRG